jgi:hypothetical protein
VEPRLVQYNEHSHFHDFEVMFSSLFINVAVNTPSLAGGEQSGRPTGRYIMYRLSLVRSMCRQLH